MAFSGDFVFHSLLRFAIVLSFTLTLVLLSYVAIKKEDLKTEESRKALKNNMRLFWAALFLLFTPLVLFLVFETIALAGLLSKGDNSAYESFRSLLVTGAFLILNIGLASSIYLSYKMGGTES